MLGRFFLLGYNFNNGMYILLYSFFCLKDYRKKFSVNTVMHTSLSKIVLITGANRNNKNK